MYPTFIRLIPFRPNIFELSQEKFLQACDIFRFFLCLYILYMVWLKIRGQRPEGEGIAKYIVGILVDLGIVGMYMTAWIISYYFSREHI